MQPRELPGPSAGRGCSQEQSRDARGSCGALDRGTAAGLRCHPHVPSWCHRGPLSPCPGCPTEWDGVSCWPALPLGQSRAVACPDILNVFKKSEGWIHRNCTKWGWSLPSPPYHSACQLEPLGSSNDTEAKARGTPGAVGSCPHGPFPSLGKEPWRCSPVLEGGAVPACPTPALPSPCPLTVLLSLPERPFCHHEGALHLRLLHVAGSAAPGHRHLLLLQEAALHQEFHPHPLLHLLHPAGHRRVHQGQRPLLGRVHRPLHNVHGDLQSSHRLLPVLSAGQLLLAAGGGAVPADAAAAHLHLRQELHLGLHPHRLGCPHGHSWGVGAHQAPVRQPWVRAAAPWPSPGHLSHMSQSKSWEMNLWHGMLRRGGLSQRFI
uniref:Vasoactive intestinal polypeptide receptor 1-like n=1 Tax=Cyanistes caeruleus TaxID=156563 RepID=A0A8C0VMG6_CYACU